MYVASGYQANVVIYSSSAKAQAFVCFLCYQDGADGSMLADNLFELKNGCICCTVKDDLVTTLETLLERRNKFDYIIIETTGLANPVGAVIRVSSLFLSFVVHAELLIVYTRQVPWQRATSIIYWYAQYIFSFPKALLLSMVCIGGRCS